VIFTGIIMAFSIKPINKTTTKSKIIYTSSIESINTGKQLMETKCNICHGIKDNAAVMLAPPFINIKSKYMAVYKTEAAFEKGIVAFSINPSKEKALMIGSLNKFSVMPKLGYQESNLKKITKYIYSNKMEKPSWFK